MDLSHDEKHLPYDFTKLLPCDIINIDIFSSTAVGFFNIVSVLSNLKLKCKILHVKTKHVIFPIYQKIFDLHFGQFF